jgi:hypothetical protein
MLRKNCLLKHVIKGKTEGLRRRGRNLNRLLDDLQENNRDWNLKGEGGDRTGWITRLGREYAPVARQAME